MTLNLKNITLNVEGLSVEPDGTSTTSVRIHFYVDPDDLLAEVDEEVDRAINDSIDYRIGCMEAEELVSLFNDDARLVEHLDPAVVLAEAAALKERTDG